MQSLPIKDGVIDVVFSPDENIYYLQRYQFGPKTCDVSIRSWPSAQEAVAAMKAGRVRWKKD